MIKHIVISTIALSLTSAAFASFAFDGTFSTPGDYDTALMPDGWYSGKGNGSLDPSNPLPDQNNVEDNVRVVPDPTGGTTAFSGNVLFMGGQASPDPMDHWLTNLDVSQPTQPFAVSFDFWLGTGIPTDPSEFFVRFDRWGNYFAVKPQDTTAPVDGGPKYVEGAGSVNTTFIAPLETVHNFKVMFDVELGSITGYTAYINGTEVLSAMGSYNFNQIELRSQKVPAYVDNLSVEIVPEPAMIGLLTAGAGVMFLALRRRR